jgi:hypothetical protein
MKITKEQLKQIIKEELEDAMGEGYSPFKGAERMPKKSRTNLDRAVGMYVDLEMGGLSGQGGNSKFYKLELEHSGEFARPFVMMSGEKIYLPYSGSSLFLGPSMKGTREDGTEVMLGSNGRVDRLSTVRRMLGEP